MLLVKTYLDRSPIHGLGVFALEAIPQGTPVARYVAGLDARLDRESVMRLPADWQDFLARYGYSPPDDPGHVYCSLDHARFINHSETPNLDDRAETTVAARDIAAGEELTSDYRVLCQEDPCAGGEDGDALPPSPQKEVGGRSPDKPDATRYGDWEKEGRCVDF